MSAPSALPDRVFLGWDRPPLESARDWLFGIASRLGPSLDLSGICVCVPSAHARRHLLGALIEAARLTTGDAVLIPPEILTPRTMVERFEDSTRGVLLRPATSLAKRLAWLQALESLPHPAFRALRGITDESVPDGGAEGNLEALAGSDPRSGLGSLASLVATSHARLTAEHITFRAAFERLGIVQSAALEARLRALAEAETAYERILCDARLDDPAFFRARHADTGEHVSLSVAWTRIVLVGVVDLPAALRRFLEAGFDNRCQITPLVFAPLTQAHAFDRLGGLDREFWSRAAIDLSDARIHIVETVPDLIDAAFEQISNIHGTTRSAFRASGFALCVPEESTLPSLVRRGRLYGVGVRPSTGSFVRRTPLCTLLRATLDFSREPTFRNWGTLLRHPLLERAVLATPQSDPLPASVAIEGYLSVLDRYVLEHLPDLVTVAFVEGRDSAALAMLFRTTLTLLHDLAPSVEPATKDTHRSSRRERRLSAWAPSIAGFLRRILSLQPAPPLPSQTRIPSDSDILDSTDHDWLEQSIKALDEALGQLATLAHSPLLDRPLAADAALSAVLQLLGDQRLASADSDSSGVGQIRAVGWLDLSLDPSAHVVIVGLSEGSIPSREPNDPFFTPSMLRILGIQAPETRAARDAYLLTLLARSRASLSILLARRGHDGEAIMPSRLLFQADEPTILSRARLWSPSSVPSPVAKPRPRRAASTTEFKSLQVQMLPVPQRWSVTSFRDYLSSPYLYYLKHIAKLSELDSISIELNPRRFGTLIHDTLSDFGRSPEHDQTDATKIRHSLHDLFHQRLARAFGPALSTPLWLQSQQALGRLDAFALDQAQRADQGWRILHSEWSPEDPLGVPFAWEGGSIRLGGRIDRIDDHPTLGLALIDYKLFDSPKAPDKTHRVGDRWIDLQLPLYRHLAAEVIARHGRDTAPQLAYCILSADGRSHFDPARWSTAILDSADETAREVIRAVHAGEFREEGSDPPTSGTFGALAGYGHLGEVADEDEEGAP